MTDAADRFLALARQQIAQGQTRGATESLRQALSQDPDHVEAHALLSLLLLEMRRLHAAGHEAELALGLDPQVPLALFASAQVLLARRRLDAAEERIEALLEAAPDWPAAHLALAHLYELTGRREQARPVLEKALALDPADPDVLADLGEWHLDGGDLESAERRAREALEEAPEHAGALVLMGHVLLRRGRVEEAREHAVWALRAGGGRRAMALLASVKARQSYALGLWYRWSTWMGTLGDGRAILVLLGAYVLYRLGVLAAEDAGQQDVAQWLQIVWLLVVAYTWVGPGWFQRTLQKEVGEVELAKEF